MGAHPTLLGICGRCLQESVIHYALDGINFELTNTSFILELEVLGRFNPFPGHPCFEAVSHCRCNEANENLIN